MFFLWSVCIFYFSFCSSSLNPQNFCELKNKEKREWKRTIFIWVYGKVVYTAKVLCCILHCLIAPVRSLRGEFFQRFGSLKLLELSPRSALLLSSTDNTIAPPLSRPWEVESRYLKCIAEAVNPLFFSASSRPHLSILITISKSIYLNQDQN